MTDIRADAPPQVPFLFQSSQKRVGSSLGVSLLVHGLVFALFIWIANRPVVHSATNMLPDLLNKEIVWLDMPGPGGGGGGGGNQMKEPPKQAQEVGKEKITVPAVKPVELQAPKPKDNPEPPVQQLSVPAQTMASSANLSLPGVIEGAPSGESLGSGTGGGAGTGNGTGIGPGQGSGLGPGYGGGFGGGAYQPGNGVSTPVLLKEVKPQYTAQAMRAKIQGTVLLECVVEPDGTVNRMKVVRSLDSTFGLDQEAMKAASQWHFKPGLRQGQPVPVLVTIEIAFTLR